MKIWELLMMAAANAGGAPGPSVADLFSVDLWTGNGQNGRNIVTGLDMSGDGGLVWLKRRDGPFSHLLHDSERTVTQALVSNSNTGEFTSVGGLQSFASNGFIVGSGPANGTGDPFVAWSFKKAAGFFDIVTYTGNGTAGRTVAHNLGSVPGMIWIKRLDARDWNVYHRAVDATAPEDFRLVLNDTTIRANNATVFNDTAPTSTNFTLGTEIDVNASGQNYVAYVFAHEPTGNIQCGSYTGNGSGTGPTVNLGWQPQFLLIKRATVATANWVMLDTSRGLGAGNDAVLRPNLSSQEGSFAYMDVLATGFQVTSAATEVNANGSEYIYMAIRAE